MMKSKRKILKNLDKKNKITTIKMFKLKPRKLIHLK